MYLLVSTDIPPELQLFMENLETSLGRGDWGGVVMGNLELFGDLKSELTSPRLDRGGLVCGDLRCIHEGYRLVKLLLNWH